MEDGRKGWDDSLISLGLGALVVVISGILLYNFFSNTSQDLLKDISTSMQTSREEEQLANPSFAPAEIVPTDTPIPLAQIQTEGQGELVVPVVSASAVPSVLPSQEAVAAASPIVNTSPTTQVVENSPEPKQAETVTNEMTSTFEGTVSDSYTVQAGDSLWKIAERFYGDGFKWREIAKANDISNPSKLEKGLALNVPREGMTSSANTTASATETANSENESSVSATTNIGVGGGAAAGVADAQRQDAAGQTEYVVQKGENLASIVQKQCGSGTSWVHVAKDNKLVNPRVIHAGNKLLIGCNR